MEKPRFRDLKHGKSTAALPPKKKRTVPQAIFPDKRTRTKAFITDSFMLLMAIMYVVFYVIMGGREGFAANKLLGWAYIVVPLVFVQIAFLAKSGQTPGMRAYGIKLVDADTMKAPPFWHIVIRQIAAPFSRLLFGWIVMFFRSDHRQPHELISHTALILADDPSMPNPTS